MYTKEQIDKLIKETHKNMERSKELFGKEIYQKRFKPLYEGYITALCTVLELDEDSNTDLIRAKK